MKNLKYPALFVAAALYACPGWALAQDAAAPAASAEEAPAEDRAEGEAPGSDTSDAGGPGSVNQQDTDDTDDTAAGARPAAGRDAAGARGQAKSGAGTGAGAGAAARGSARGEASASATGQMSPDQHFVLGAASGNLMEIAAAKLAMEKSERQEVKDFAQHILADHTKASAELARAAKAAGVQVPREMKASHRAEVQELAQLDGEMFEKAFVINNVGDHVKMILKFRDASENLENSELKAFAAAQLPALQKHLEHAQQLAGWDQAMTAGSHEAGEHAEHGETDAAPSADAPAAGSRRAPAAGSTRGASGTGDRPIDEPEVGAEVGRPRSTGGKNRAGGAGAGGADSATGNQGDAAEGEPAGSDTADDRGPGSVNENDTNDADDSAK